MAFDPNRKKIGTMPCEGQRCKSHELQIPVVVFENAKGTLSYGCDYCGRSKFAKKDSEEYQDWRQDLTLFEKPAVQKEQEKPAAPKAPAAPAKNGKEKSTLFG